MLKIDRKNKKKFDYLLKVAILILIILFNGKSLVYGANNNWFEVSKAHACIEYLDRDSSNIKDKGII